jgi:hypothetical protein
MSTDAGRLGSYGVGNSALFRSFPHHVRPVACDIQRRLAIEHGIPVRQTNPLVGQRGTVENVQDFEDAGQVGYARQLFRVQPRRVEIIKLRSGREPE